jgi:hypothetical protein
MTEDNYDFLNHVLPNSVDITRNIRNDLRADARGCGIYVQELKGNCRIYI